MSFYPRPESAKNVYRMGGSLPWGIFIQQCTAGIYKATYEPAPKPRPINALIAKQQAQHVKNKATILHLLSRQALTAVMLKDIMDIARTAVQIYTTELLEEGRIEFKMGPKQTRYFRLKS